MPAEDAPPTPSPSAVPPVPPVQLEQPEPGPPHATEPSATPLDRGTRVAVQAALRLRKR